MPVKNPKNARIIALGNPQETLLGSIRVSQWDHVFPKSYKDLDWDGVPGHEDEIKVFASGFWKFMAPFFLSRGYTLYVKDPIWDSMVPAPSPKATDAKVEYPFSRMIDRNKPPEKAWSSFSTWPARDQQGRDVMIKAISDASEPSNELKVMLRLNEKQLRSDPFNHTICALEFLKFDEIVFVVMPRWDSAFLPDFVTVSELMYVTKTFLEVFVFLHKHRIVHHDFLTQNTGMNVVLDGDDIFWHKGLRDPSEVRYTLFDFGNALMFPEDSIIEDIIETRFLNWALGDVDAVEGPYNPFKADMAFLGLALQTRVRHLENIIPELGPFFDRLVDALDPTQFSASQALSRFMEIYDSLTESQLQSPVHTWLWKKGKILEKWSD